MNRRVFTEYVRFLSAGEPVDSDLFEAVLAKLRDALIAELKKRGLWSYPVLVRLVRPDSGFEQRESFGKLVACVAEFLDRHEAGEKTRIYLERLWSFLRSHASEPETPGTEAGASKLPSRREV